MFSIFRHTERSRSKTFHFLISGNCQTFNRANFSLFSYLWYYLNFHRFSFAAFLMMRNGRVWRFYYWLVFWEVGMFVVDVGRLNRLFWYYFDWCLNDFSDKRFWSEFLVILRKSKRTYLNVPKITYVTSKLIQFFTKIHQNLQKVI